MDCQCCQTAVTPFTAIAEISVPAFNRSFIHLHSVFSNGFYFLCVINFKCLLFQNFEL